MSDLGIGSDGSEISIDLDLGQGTGPDSDDSLANPFLAKIPEADREVVGRYIKDWDSGVTKRFQQIHEQYRPYKDLGVEAQELQEAYALQQMIQEDPERIYTLLGQILQQEGSPGVQGGQEMPATDFGDDLPPAFVEKFTRMEQVLEQMATRFLESEQQSVAAQEDAQLDAYLSDLHSKHGDFDEDWVLSKMLKGMDGEKAVAEYNNFVQGVINSRLNGKRPVPVLGGGGAIPHGGVDPTKLNRTQTQDLVAKMLADAQGQ